MSDAPTRVLLITKGHPFDYNAFFAVFDANPAIEWTHIEHPAAQRFFAPELARDYDVFVLYDMPGLVFREGEPPALQAPPEQLRQDLAALLAQGKGLVFLHHALAGWPAWPEYGELIGGRFLYQPTKVRGRDCLDSGYRHEVTHGVRVLDPEHPVTRGLPANFTLTDELYLAEIFEDSVHPLLASDHDFKAANFYSADHAVRGRMFCNDDWPHPPGSSMIGWVRRARRSPIVYLQCGDGPGAYANEHYRRLVANAIAWAASPEAHAWARAA